MQVQVFVWSGVLFGGAVSGAASVLYVQKHIFNLQKLTLLGRYEHAFVMFENCSKPLRVFWGENSFFLRCRLQFCISLQQQHEHEKIQKKNKYSVFFRGEIERAE